MNISQQKPDFNLEQKYLVKGLVVGVDEAGRGPWAGPVVAAAVWIDPKLVSSLPKGIRDSKKLTSAQRDYIHNELLNLNIAAAVGSADVKEIDEYNILNASFLAMERALVLLQKKLPYNIGTILVDGNRQPEFNAFGEKQNIIPVIKGDNISVSIASASIVAKQIRDSYMSFLDLLHPEYEFRKHKGYGTKVHSNALAKFGLTCHHRLSFAPIRALKR